MTNARMMNNQQHQRHRKRPRRPSTQPSPRWSLLLQLTVLPLLLALSFALTYEHNPENAAEVKTRHTRNQRKTGVAVDDLDLGGLDPSVAAERVMDRIGEKVRHGVCVK
jgi:hypothetical protein